MIEKLINYLKSLFIQKEIKQSAPIKKKQQGTPLTRLLDESKKPENKNIPQEKLTPTPTTTPKKTAPSIDKHILMQKIRTNIFFLEDLIIKLEGIQKYRIYYLKLKDLKKQSEGSFKIVYKMKNDAPYYNSTLKAILIHTNTIESLFKSKKN